MKPGTLQLNLEHFQLPSVSYAQSQKVHVVVCFLGAFTFPPNNLICIIDFTSFHQHFHQPPEEKGFEMSIQL